jgi:hypothetical protein
LGRYFYDIPAIWVDLDQNRRPVRTPVLSGWALPENWRRGMRPLIKNGNGNSNAGSQSARSNGGSNGNHGQAATRTTNAGGATGHGQTGESNGSAATVRSDDLDQRILEMEKVVGTGFYRNILREYGRVNQPKLIRDAAIKRKVLQMLESATRGFGRLDDVIKRLDPNTVKALLAKLQAPPLAEITDLKTLRHVVLGLEELAGPNQHHVA